MSKKIYKSRYWYKENGWTLIEDNLEFEKGHPSETIKMLQNLVDESAFDELEILVNQVDCEYTDRSLWGKKKGE